MKSETIKLIYNRKSTISSIVFSNKCVTYISTNDALKLIFDSLKNNKAKKIIDNDETLMYKIKMN